MAWTSSDLTALEKAIASGKGAQTIQFADQRITFYSVGDMLQLRAAMQRAIAGDDVVTHRLATTSKGFD